ncbi:KRAB-A domain-containing protein 2-like [Polistes fuscatus]|uniref:KRAB-A domain-containing protein 2-like n=1 Tax=Polistes fuscatus TaxID=30207 RepID=UPI001CA937AA|nr:KRAB-A domain-containing protein 2-like [Polistes fuscatus]
MEKQAVILRNKSWPIEMKQRFDDEVSKMRVNAARNSFFLTETSYQKLINDVQNAKTTTKKESRDYKLLKRYDVIIIGKKSKLIYPLKEGVNTIQYYITDSELFHILHEAHLATGHGGRDKMSKELSTKYKNITRHDLELYIHLCEPCQKKKKGIKKGIVLKPMIMSEFNSRCQVDLIDFQSQPDREYKFIMVYQDHLTQFVILKSLTSEKAEEVANNLVEIFSLLGAPSILQSDNGREFANNVVTSLKKLWPALNIVHGKLRHSQNQDSQRIAKKMRQDIENMLSIWMQDNNSSHWSEGLRFVQFMKNSTYHFGIKKTPYEALFGCEYINTEEELEKIIESVETMEKGETNQITPEKEPVLKNLDKIIVDNELSQHYEDMPTEDITVLDTCCVCLNETNDTLVCRKCRQDISNFCGHTSKDNENSIEDKINFKIKLEIEAKKRKRNSENEFPTVSLGTNVQVPIPDDDKGERSDSCDILAVVMNVTENGFYRLGTSKGILKEEYARSQFTLCTKNLLRIEDIPNHEISLQSVAIDQFSGSSQEFVKCTCKGNCRTMKCLCVKNVIKCNSKCHSSLPCCNN